jgi:NAD(P)-dependent dehydrogenase (short-subunit alcohol dehydrogenase family)
MNVGHAIPPAVLVIGGSGGLGSHVCDLIAARGMRPIVGWVHNQQIAEAVASRCGGTSARIDVTRPQEAVAEAERVIGQSPLAGVVLAGAEPPSIEIFGKLDVGALRQRLELDVFGNIAVLNPLVRRYLKPNRKGTVVAVLSEAMGTPEKASMPAMAGYVIGKYALAGVCAALAADNPWLRVHTVTPGFMETAMLKAFDERFVEGLRRAGKVVSPSQAAMEVVDAITGTTA